MKKYISGISIIFFTLIVFLSFFVPERTSAGKIQTTIDEKNLNSEKEMDLATFGAGCFWCVEAVFQRLNGVHSVVSGYTGGDVKNPTYKEVCNGTTGHAEVVQISYDPTIITFKELLEIFWKTHDPTTLNQQGADVGTQYRSAIFYHSEEQKSTAEYFKKQLDDAGVFSKPIVTEIVPFTKLYKAENYHQDYYDLNKSQPYCRVVITPKIEKLEKLFKEKLNSKYY